jgi:hypothetical protein
MKEKKCALACCCDQPDVVPCSFIDEKVFATTPTNNKGNKIFLHFICTICFNPDLGPLQVLFYNSFTTILKSYHPTH